MSGISQGFRKKDEQGGGWAKEGVWRDTRRKIGSIFGPGFGAEGGGRLTSVQRVIIFASLSRKLVGRRGGGGRMQHPAFGYSPCGGGWRGGQTEHEVNEKRGSILPPQTCVRRSRRAPRPDPAAGTPATGRWSVKIELFARYFFGRRGAPAAFFRIPLRFAN